MELNKYQAEAQSTAIYPGRGTPAGLFYSTLKLTGEAGEVSEKLGKLVRDNGMVLRNTDTGRYEIYNDMTPPSREGMAKELGDVLWYVSAVANDLGYTLEGIAQMNLDKLADRAARGKLQGSGDNR